MSVSNYNLATVGAWQLTSVSTCISVNNISTNSEYLEDYVEAA